MKRKITKKISVVYIILILAFSFYFSLYGQVYALDFNVAESTGGMVSQFLNSFLTMIDSIITGEDYGTIEYNIYEFEEAEILYNIGSDNVVQYYQNDFKYVSYGSSNIANCGCGPTCFAMLASTYTGREITPKDAVSWCGNTYYIKRNWNVLGLF